MPLNFDENGLQVRQGAEILSDWEARTIRFFGAGSQVSQDTQSNISKLLGEFADRDSLIDEILEAIYLSAYPSTSGGVSLDRVLEITGHVRQGAQSSVLNGTMFATGTPSIVIGIGELQMSVLQSGDLFINTIGFTLGVIGDTSADTITRSGTTVTITIGGGHSYPINSWVFIEGADQPEYNILAQITAITATTFNYEISGVLPTTPATGTFLVREATPFSAQSVEEGAIQALQGSLTVIEVTPDSGLSRIENVDDAVLGVETETDPEVRARRNLTLGVLGGGTPEAIKGIILNVAGVTEVIVFKNDESFIDVDGRPPHSVEVLVAGGADQDIFDALTGNETQKGAVSAGIKQHGNITGSVIDSSNNPQPAAFSRLAPVPIFVDIVVITNDDPTQGPIFPGTGAADIIDNLSSLIFAGGADVWKATITNAVTSVPGVVSVVPKFGKTASPTLDVTVVILPTEQANIDSGDITGTIDGVPI